MTASPTIGVIGVGTIAEAVIRALHARPGGAPPMLLSPRSEARSRALAAEFDGCTRLASNQEVIDASDIVVLAMRPQEMEAALAELAFRPDQVIASFIAVAPPSVLAPLVHPATRIAQLIPLPAIELLRGPLLICPGLPEITDAFADLGEVIVIDDETRIRAFSVMSAFMSTYFELVNTVIDWGTNHGLDRATAARYVLAELDGLAATGKATPLERLPELADEHQTRGGLNERIRTAMTEAGTFTHLIAALDNLYDTTSSGLKGES